MNTPEPVPEWAVKAERKILEWFYTPVLERTPEMDEGNSVARIIADHALKEKQSELTELIDFAHGIASKLNVVLGLNEGEVAFLNALPVYHPKEKQPENGTVAEWQEIKASAEHAAAPKETGATASTIDDPRRVPVESGPATDSANPLPPTELKSDERRMIADEVLKYIDSQELDELMNDRAVKDLKSDIRFIITKEKQDE